MENILPFGSGISSDIPIQKFMGCSVAKFDCSVDFGSQPGSCNIVLIQDDSSDIFTPQIIGSPQFFKIVDTNGVTIFKYNGILDSISRDTSAGDKTYKVSLVSPLKILEAITIITDGYTGYGQTVEGLPRFYSEDGYYEIAESDKQNGYLPEGVTMTPAVDYFLASPYSFSSNNRSIQWDKVFNLINVYGFYENEAISATSFSGYGASSLVRNGMRFDKIVYALNELINNTPGNSSRRYLGGNMLYGSNTYNVCGTSSGYVPPIPYYYGIDIISFAQYILNYLPESFLISGPSISLSELISTVCDAINADFIVELNDSSYNNGFFAANMEQTYPLSTFGGIISITLIPKNEFINCSRPFNDFTYDLINLERPDMGDYQYAGKINPGTFVSSVGVAASNPIDFDFSYRGTEGSYPYGGKFPVGTKSDSRGTTYDSIRAESIQVSLKASPGTVAKMVIGGNQSRMNVVPRDFIYHYWGEIILTEETNDVCGINSKSQKIVPVITQILPPNDTWDWIAIDCQSIFGNATVPGVIYKGIYFASLMEIRAALNSREAWDRFMNSFKVVKKELIDNHIWSSLLAETATRYENILKHFFVKGNVPTNTSESLKGKGKRKDAANLIFEKVKNIADTHYGKSWIAPVPFCKSKVTSSEDNLVGNIERSWEVSDSAYVEPYAFGSIEAPKDSLFMDGGRLRAFVNYEHSFPSSGNIGYDVITQSLTGPVGGTLKYDFSEYSSDVVFDFDPSASGNCPLVGLAHVKPNSISKTYTYIPKEYFYVYNRGRCPFIDTVDQSGVAQFGQYYCYSYNYPEKGPYQQINENKINLMESLVNDSNNKTFFSELVVESLVKGVQQVKVGESKFSTEATYADADMSRDWTTNDGSYSWNPGLDNQIFYLFKTAPSPVIWEKYLNKAENFSDNSYAPYFSWSHTGSAMNVALDGIINNYPNDYGNGMPFVRFETNRVYYPDTISKDGYDPLSEDFLDQLSKDIESNIKNKIAANKNNQNNINTKSFVFSKNGVKKPCVAPRSVAIPQQSNRYTYGPWMTNFDGIIYAGKFEFEQHQDLVPENHLIPVYGTVSTDWKVMNKNGEIVRVIDSVNGTVLSGMAGMNLAGQAIANSIDNFSMFAQEEGTITLPGLPLIQKLGDVLFNGPRITDINISFDGPKVSTTYNFRAISPRYGKNDKELLKSIRKISNTLRTKISE